VEGRGAARARSSIALLDSKSFSFLVLGLVFGGRTRKRTKNENDSIRSDVIFGAVQRQEIEGIERDSDDRLADD